MAVVYFEDIEVGEKVSKPGLYEVTKEEIMEVAGRWDPRPFHIDEAAAAASIFGGLVACSVHVFSILSLFAASAESRTATIAALGFDDIRLLHPVRPGDKLSCSFTCLEKRESTSRKDRGIVRHRGVLSNTDNVEVFSAVATVLVLKRP